MRQLLDNKERSTSMIRHNGVGISLFSSWFALWGIELCLVIYSVFAHQVYVVGEEGIKEELKLVGYESIGGPVRCLPFWLSKCCEVGHKHKLYSHGINIFCCTHVILLMNVFRKAIFQYPLGHFVLVFS
jgi:hypothetical protein